MRIRAILAAAVVLVSLLSGLLVTPAHGEHETRQQVLQETGVDVVPVALTIAAAVLVLALFAAVILRWERRDEEAERRARQQASQEESGKI